MGLQRVVAKPLLCFWTYRGLGTDLRRRCETQVQAGREVLVEAVDVKNGRGRMLEEFCCAYRVVEEESQPGDFRYSEYEAGDNLTKKTDRDGRVTQYVYDDLNRNTQELWKDGQTTVRTITFGYDDDGRLTSGGDIDGAIGYAYDHLGRAVSITQTIDGLTPDIELLQWFDIGSNRTYAWVYLGGAPNTANVYSTCYDNLNRLTRVVQSGPTGAVALKEAYFMWDGLDRMTYMNRYEYVPGVGWPNPENDAYTYLCPCQLAGADFAPSPAPE